MFDAPLKAYVIGVLASEVLQWAFWLRKNPGHGLFEYFSSQVATLIGNMGVNVAVGFLWKMEGLDALLGWAAGLLPVGAADWAESGVPYTPQVGLMLGCFCDFFGDDLAFNLVEMARGRLLGKQSTAPPAPPAQKETT